MENAPMIILFWLFYIMLFILMLALMIAAIILMKKSETKSSKMKWLGKVCVILSIICSIPIILVVGYILYLYIC